EGHKIKVIKSENLYYQKEEQPMRHWFDGEYHHCERESCEWRRYYGDRTSYATDVPNSKKEQKT
ncbi:MAG TPA: hypothetical protein VIY47_08195, partial [Ignavibacteriaceae bacterium]